MWKKEPLTKEEKDRTMVIFILVAFCIFFWADLNRLVVRSPFIPTNTLIGMF